MKGVMHDLGLLVMRLTTGGLLAGHGAQKVFGMFGGRGLEGTGAWMESLGMRPGKAWALLAGGSELGGGLLTASGLMHPIGPIVVFGPMSTAIVKVHWGKPIWASAGGGELPVTNMAVATGMILAGPGRFSLDRLLGIRVPRGLALLTAAGVAAGVIYGATRSKPSPQAAPDAGTGAREASEDGQSQAG